MDANALECDVIRDTARAADGRPRPSSRSVAGPPVNVRNNICRLRALGYCTIQLNLYRTRYDDAYGDFHNDSGKQCAIDIAHTHTHTPEYITYTNVRVHNTFVGPLLSCDKYDKSFRRRASYFNKHRLVDKYGGTTLAAAFVSASLGHLAGLRSSQQFVSGPCGARSDTNQFDLRSVPCACKRVRLSMFGFL